LSTLTCIDVIVIARREAAWQSRVAPFILGIAAPSLRSGSR
jgi:hypothetical protein